MVSFYDAPGVFHALGDVNRLKIVSQLCTGEPMRVSDIAAGFDMTRPAVSKHLRILETAGVLRVEWRGREKYCHVRPEGLALARDWIARHEQLWAGALGELKAHFQEQNDRE
ncbi:ArsR/SmtB family transcription factor [Hoeflea prorocentri]|uniref:Metalloregulator ArsR/SmtB family transcription factor n=1 Tax=Hoeflea prorocentri TaxID=1922333 RepID=A0A9X3ZK56_9HYPH|nr:metalloregulator ArsR/SmtB family transcription factor [Hoeflea prorocentri]MCY6383671.1 metalloregulator ArsR/SmtB family transcription factor [Hoeflea prorocentri]MDA5401471.1 metalloregulator ArsR/SmtB family transcription factor [Hoeflea prorocentri]